MTFDCNKLKGLKKRLCEGWTLDTKGEWRKLSEREHERYIALFSGNPVPPKEASKLKKSKPQPIAVKEGVGTELGKLFENIRFSSCGRCAKLSDQLNRWGPDECERRRDEILDRLKENARLRKDLKKLFTKTGAGIFLDQAISNARKREAGLSVPEGIVENVIDLAKSKLGLTGRPRVAGSLVWSYGITTVPERFNTTFSVTLESLVNAGFDRPHLFVDRCVDDKPYLNLGLPCTFHWANIRTYGNWMASLWELYISNPTADRYAIFQDDMIAYRGLREYLEVTPYPGEGYLNLYTYTGNHRKIQGKPVGWHRSNQLGKGAVALVLNNKAAVDLLSHPRMVRRIQNKERSFRYVDGAIVEAFKKIGQTEFVHNPTLVQHIGDKSSMGNTYHGNSPSWAGDEFNAMELVSK
jgi:hypothetical protein